MLRDVLSQRVVDTIVFFIEEYDGWEYVERHHKDLDVYIGIETLHSEQHNTTHHLNFVVYLSSKQPNNLIDDELIDDIHARLFDMVSDNTKILSMQEKCEEDYISPRTYTLLYNVCCQQPFSNTQDYY